MYLQCVYSSVYLPPRGQVTLCGVRELLFNIDLSNGLLSDRRQDITRIIVDLIIVGPYE